MCRFPAVSFWIFVGSFFSFTGSHPAGQIEPDEMGAIVQCSWDEECCRLWAKACGTIVCLPLYIIYI